jgi:hypothetical protein
MPASVGAIAPGIEFSGGVGSPVRMSGWNKLGSAPNGTYATYGTYELDPLGHISPIGRMSLVCSKGPGCTLAQHAYHPYRPIFLFVGNANLP